MKTILENTKNVIMTMLYQTEDNYDKLKKDNYRMYNKIAINYVITIVFIIWLIIALIGGGIENQKNIFFNILNLPLGILGIIIQQGNFLNFIGSSTGFFIFISMIGAFQRNKGTINKIIYARNSLDKKLENKEINKSYYSTKLKELDSIMIYQNSHLFSGFIFSLIKNFIFGGLYLLLSILTSIVYIFSNLYNVLFILLCTFIFGGNLIAGLIISSLIIGFISINPTINIKIQEIIGKIKNFTKKIILNTVGIYLFSEKNYFFISKTEENPIEEIIEETIEESIDEEKLLYNKFATNNVNLVSMTNPIIARTMEKVNYLILSIKEDLVLFNVNKKERLFVENQKRAFNNLPYCSKEIQLLDGENHYRIPIHLQATSFIPTKFISDSIDLKYAGIPHNSENGGYVQWYLDTAKDILYVEVLVEQPEEEEIRLPGLNIMNLTTEKFLENDGLFDFSKGKILITVGVDAYGNKIKVDFAKNPHLLIAGITGSGKSSIVNEILCGIINFQSPEQVGLRLIDPKGVEYTMFSKVAHLLNPVVKTNDGTKREYLNVLQVIKNHFNEMQRRQKLFGDNEDIFEASSNIQNYNEKNPDKKLKYEFLFVDEFADITSALWSSNDKEVKKIGYEIFSYLQRIAAKGRALGIYLVLITQKPTSQIIPSILQSNLTNAICFKTDDFRQTIDVLGTVKNLDALPHVTGYKDNDGNFGFYQKGQALIKNPELNKNLQTFYIDDKTVKKDLIKNSMKIYGEFNGKLELDEDIKILDDEEEEFEEEKNILEEDSIENNFPYLIKHKDNIGIIAKVLINLTNDGQKISKQTFIDYSREEGLTMYTGDIQYILKELVDIGVLYMRTNNSPRELGEYDTLKLIEKRIFEVINV